MTQSQMVRTAAETGLVIFVDADGTTYGIGTQPELAAMIADGILPATTGSRPVTDADL